MDHARSIHGQLWLWLLPLTAACGGGYAAGRRRPGCDRDGHRRRRSSTAQGQQMRRCRWARRGRRESSRGAAKDAYDRGFQAWASGDLAGAKTAFNDAIGKAPRAAGPRYSLGCVLERLGDIAGGARRVPRCVHGEPQVRGRDWRLRAPARADRPRSGRRAGPRRQAVAEPGLRPPDDVPGRGEVDRGRQPGRSGARAAGPRQAAGLQRRDDRHRARLLPRPPVGSREVRAAGDPRRRRRRLDPAARQGQPRGAARCAGSSSATWVSARRRSSTSRRPYRSGPISSRRTSASAR